MAKSGYAGGDRAPGKGHADADGLETVAEFRCAPECPVRRLGEQTGVLTSNGGKGPHMISGKRPNDNRSAYGDFNPISGAVFGDRGTASRFFPNHDYALDIAERIAAADPVAYVAKASRRERNAGLDGWPERMPDNAVDRASQREGREGAAGRGSRSKPRANLHPTVKPLALARWLATLLLPPDAYAPRRILIPFAGSGSECIGAMLAGWEDVVGVEREAEYVAIAEARLAWWAANRDKAPEVRAMGDQPELAKQPNGRPAKGETAAYGRFVGNHRTNGRAAPPAAGATLVPLPGFEAVG